MAKRISTLVKDADRALQRLGKERDKLRQIHSDVEDYLEETDNAIDDIRDAKRMLESAADYLSQRV